MSESIAEQLEKKLNAYKAGIKELPKRDILFWSIFSTGITISGVVAGSTQDPKMAGLFIGATIISLLIAVWRELYGKRETKPPD